MLFGVCAAKAPELPACRVAALQNMLVPLCEIPAADQILILSGKPLDAKRPLSAYGLPVRITSDAVRCSLTLIMIACPKPHLMRLPSPCKPSLAEVIWALNMYVDRRPPKTGASCGLC